MQMYMYALFRLSNYAQLSMHNTKSQIHDNIIQVHYNVTTLIRDQ